MPFPSSYSGQYSDDIDDDDFGPDFCRHGYSIRSSSCTQCNEIDEEIERQGGIDKCMNCGRYRYGNQLNEFQTCIKPCVNPNEY